MTLSEGVFFAGMAKAPNGYSPISRPEKALTRRNAALKATDEAGMLSTEKRVQAQGKSLGLNVHEQKTPLGLIVMSIWS